MTPADLKGMKIRIVELPIQQRFVAGLGASPSPIPWPEMYTTFSTGIVQGYAPDITPPQARHQGVVATRGRV